MIDYTTIQQTQADGQRVINALTSQMARRVNEVRVWLRTQVDPSLVQRAWDAHAELDRAQRAQRASQQPPVGDPLSRVRARVTQEQDAQTTAAWVVEAQRDAAAADRALASAEYERWNAEHRAAMAHIESTNKAIEQLDEVEHQIKLAEQALGTSVGAALRDGLARAHQLVGGEQRKQALERVAWLRSAAEGLGIPAHVYWTLQERNARHALY